MRLQQFYTWLNLPEASFDTEISGVCLDSRKIKPGQLFVALPKGHNRWARITQQQDGHDYIQEAVLGGAAAIMVSKPVAVDIPCLLVKDTARALIQSASAYQANIGAKKIAITGSCGKTSTKNMLASIMSLAGKTYATHGNQNNLLGLPLTILNAPNAIDYMVLEMGANQMNEIKELTLIAQPDVSVVTMAGLSHLEGFGSQDGVAKEKGELFANLSKGKTAIINADDHYADYWRELSQHVQVISFGCRQNAQVSAREIRQYGADNLGFDLKVLDQVKQVRLQLVGSHNVYNALAAAAAAHALGVGIEQIVVGLEQYKNMHNRLKLRAGVSKCKLIDDSYNANPTAFMVALDALKTLGGDRKVVVMGDMLELGDESKHWHKEVGTQAKRLGVAHLYSFGEDSKHASFVFGEDGGHFSSIDELIAKVRPKLDADTVVLIKGSRGMGMEAVVASFCEEV